MMRPRNYTLYFLLTLLIIQGCKKFDPAPKVNNPSYLRVFNDIPYAVGPFTSGKPPFLVFLLDPVMDKDGAATGGAQVGDYLTQRQPFSTSYPINAGNGGIPQNYDYPGTAHVQTAPVINGLDLSAWAGLPSGKHRVMFLRRPQTDTPFARLPVKARQDVLIDTVIDFQEGKVNTMHVVATDPDKNKFGLYIRNETFIDQTFDPGKVYVSLYNLTGKRSAQQDNGGSALAGSFPDTLNVNFSYYKYNDDTKNFDALPFFNNVYYRTLTKRFDQANPYLFFPLLPRSDFFDIRNVIRTYSSKSPISMGTLPYINLSFYSDRNSTLPLSTIDFTGDPASFNLQNIDSSSPNNNGFYTLPNMNLITNVGGAINVYGTVNIVELVYNKVYIMQVQRVFLAPPN